MMTDGNVPAPRPPFVVHDDFLETAFELRFQSLLQQAWQERTWHVIAALPGSGKSLGIADLTHQSTSCKDTKGATHLPLLAIRAPKNGGTDLALGTAFCTIFGIVPAMPWYVRRAWLVQAMAEARVECIIIDDAQDLNLAHLAFLKDLTDNLAAPPYERVVSLCLVTAHSGKMIPLKEIFSRPDILWRQFRRRLDTERPFCVVAGHTEEEVRSILEAFETLYRDQLPDLHLLRWTRPIFTWLTHATLDPDGTKRVTMDHLTRLVTAALRRSYEQGARDVDAATLTQTAELMILRRDEIIEIAGTPNDPAFPVQEVG
ncbi:MAG: ATP-binding protein [Ktedonobacteraceae bacterium]